MNNPSFRDMMDKQMEMSGITPEQAYQDSYNHTKKLLAQEKVQQQQEITDRISGMRSIFDLGRVDSFKLK